MGWSGRLLKNTLVWTDMPGDLLQNDLDLTVAIGDIERQGIPTTNRSNNVEQVYWTNVPGPTS